MNPPLDPQNASRHWLRALDSLVFPSECVICGADSDVGPLCEPCRKEVLAAARLPACPRCAMPLATHEHATPSQGCAECHGRSLGFDAALALGPYDGPIRRLVLRLKRRSGSWVARWLVDLLLEASGDALRNFNPTQVVAVPLHWQRRLSRGHNQADAIGAGSAERSTLRILIRSVVSAPPISWPGRAGPSGPTSSEAPSLSVSQTSSSKARPSWSTTSSPPARLVDPPPECSEKQAPARSSPW